MADNKTAPQLMILDDIPFAEIKEGLLTEMNQLEPFGHGNKRPLFATRGLMIDGNPRIIGPLKNHVSFKVFAPGMPSMEAIGFGLASELLALDPYGKIDLAYHLGRSPYQKQLQLQVQAVRQHKTSTLHRR
jgi:single-stranded DNA-specific DHH superfamily exonuclease